MGLGYWFLILLAVGFTLLVVWHISNIPDGTVACLPCNTEGSTEWCENQRIQKWFRQRPGYSEYMQQYRNDVFSKSETRQMWCDWNSNPNKRRFQDVLDDAIMQYQLAIHSEIRDRRMAELNRSQRVKSKMNASLKARSNYLNGRK